MRTTIVWLWRVSIGLSLVCFGLHDFLPKVGLWRYVCTWIFVVSFIPILIRWMRDDIRERRERVEATRCKVCGRSS